MINISSLYPASRGHRPDPRLTATAQPLFACLMRPCLLTLNLPAPQGLFLREIGFLRNPFDRT